MSYQRKAKLNVFPAVVDVGRAKDEYEANLEPQLNVREVPLSLMVIPNIAPSSSVPSPVIFVDIFVIFVARAVIFNQSEAPTLYVGVAFYVMFVFLVCPWYLHIACGSIALTVVTVPHSQSISVHIEFTCKSSPVAPVPPTF